MMSLEQQVRERAYFIWEDEGRVFGRAEIHWLRAEAEFEASSGRTAAAASGLTRNAPAAGEAAGPAKTLKPRAAKPTSAAARAISAKAELAAPKATSKAAKGTTAKSTSKKVAAPRGSVSAGASLH